MYDERPDLDAIELAKAPASKRGNAEDVAEKIISRQDKIKKGWERKRAK